MINPTLRLDFRFVDLKIFIMFFLYFPINVEITATNEKCSFCKSRKRLPVPASSPGTSYSLTRACKQSYTSEQKNVNAEKLHLASSQSYVLYNLCYNQVLLIYIPSHLFLVFTRSNKQPKLQLFTV